MKDEMTKDFNNTMLERIKESAVLADPNMRDEEMMREFFTQKPESKATKHGRRPSGTSNRKFRSNRRDNEQS